MHPHVGEERRTAGEAPCGMRSALIIEDHPLFCGALSMTLKAMLAFEDIRIAGTLNAALESLAQQSAVDVILLDLNLPDVTGLDGLIQLMQAAPQTPILVVSSLSDSRIVNLALRAGASGFVPKHSQPDVFRRALLEISAGGVFSEAAGEAAADDGAEAAPADILQRLALLTPQQARILKLVCEGKLNKQIAYDLSITEATVKTHMTAILRKLGARSRTQAVLLAQQTNFSQLLKDVDLPD